jgi:integration host factor subunit alpha
VIEMTSDVSMNKLDEPSIARSKAPTSGVASFQTVTRVDLAEAVYRRVGLSRKESAVLVEMVLSEMTDRLAVGETVKLSSFGSFVVRDKGERIGRNPKTGVEVPILQRRVLVFKPSNVLKALMNGEEPPKEEN